MLSVFEKKRGSIGPTLLAASSLLRAWLTHVRDLAKPELLSMGPDS